jgi:hypothetical protein
MLELVRDLFLPTRTLGALYWDEDFLCDTLEDVVREPHAPKVMHETAIPTGTYEVIINESQRFKRLMPLLLNVPGFTGIRIHAGLHEGHTSGCILVGERTVEKTLNNPRDTYDKIVYPKIEEMLKLGKVFIEVRNR